MAERPIARVSLARRRSFDSGILDWERYREFTVDACGLAIAEMGILGIVIRYAIRTLV
jgi:hypothetical protein